MVGSSLTFSPTQGVSISDEEIVTLDSDFKWLTTTHLAYAKPNDIDSGVNFDVAKVPCTMAMLVDDELLHGKLNASDHWFFKEFSVPGNHPERVLLQLDGLLTYTDIFINNVLIRQSTNAYHSHIIEITQHLKESNHLALCFRAIAPILASKHSRPRFTTRLINERNLRFIRTPILGYTPGFSASTQAVGPYRPIRLICQRHVTVISSFVDTQLLNDNTGVVTINVNLQTLKSIVSKTFLVLTDKNTEIGRVKVKVFNDAANTCVLNGSLKTESIEAYWPHTHGKPKRYELSIEVIDEANNNIVIQLGQYGFRRIERIDPNTFALKINGTPLYLRGACWTPMNPKSLLVDAETLRVRLLWLKSAGFNMLRVPGNMLYESDAFYAICDELGILIFQDFAFANFDYPESEQALVSSIQQEARDFLAKHGGRPCLTVLAGNSEVAQQASMMGLELIHVNNLIFDQYLPEIAATLAPQVPYVCSSPNAKGIPFHSGDGPSHYYGVGGYRRDFEDARLFKGRFASECLAFSHVPEDSSLRTFFDGEILPPHHPRWKDAVPRDVGSGWDFSDITDFYVEKLFEIDAAKLRFIDQERYLSYCRAATVEVVETTLSIFRADSAKGRAALVWFLHDLKAGAGWGYIDASGKPKSSFYALARTAQPTTLVFVDEGLEGLAVYLAHDGTTTLNCELSLTLVTAEGKVYEQLQKPQLVESRSVTRISVDLFLNRFVDSSYAYQFGPRAFTSCVARLTNENSEVISQKIYANSIITHAFTHNAGLIGEVLLQNDGSYKLEISCDLPAYYVVIDIPYFEISDNYFHVLPGFSKEILLSSKNKQLLPHGRLRALNIKNSSSVKIKQ